MLKDPNILKYRQPNKYNNCRQVSFIQLKPIDQPQLLTEHHEWPIHHQRYSQLRQQLVEHKLRHFYLRVHRKDVVTKEHVRRYADQRSQHDPGYSLVPSCVDPIQSINPLSHGISRTKDHPDQVEQHGCEVKCLEVAQEPHIMLRPRQMPPTRFIGQIIH